MADPKYKALEKAAIAKGLVEGKPITHIARELGRDRTTVYHMIKTDSEFKELIISKQKSFIEKNLPIAEDTYERIGRLKGKKDLKLRLEAGRDVMKAAGVLPSGEQSYVVQQVFNQQNIYMTPVMKEILANHVKQLTGGESFDAEVVDEEKKDLGVTV